MRAVPVLAFVVVLFVACASCVPQEYSCDAGDDLQPACDTVAQSLVDAINERLAPAVSAAFTTVNGTGFALPQTKGGSFPSATFVAHTGQFTYDSKSPVVANSTTYDMASCSKIIGATTATAQLYQQGLIDLYAPVTAYLGAGFAANGKASIKVINLLLHNAGFPPDPTPYEYNEPGFGCPQTALYHPGQDFSCEGQIRSAVLQQALVNPVGAVYIYSDLSMITMMFVVAEVVWQHQLIPVAELPPLCQYNATASRICLYYAYVKKHVMERLGMTSSDYVPSSPLNTPPEWYDDGYRHGLIMGYVSDPNAYAMGGVSGHAGVFSTVSDVLLWARAWALPAPDDPYLNKTTVAVFSKQYNWSQSSRALGWDTNNQTDPPCGSLSPRTFLHLGYTGTQFCIDPDNGIVTVLLTNARYPLKSVDGAITLRPKFNSLVLSVLQNPPDAGGPGASRDAEVIWGLVACFIVVVAIIGACYAARIPQSRRAQRARHTVQSDPDDVALSTPRSAALYDAR